jgi:hypothetical protein
VREDGRKNNPRDNAPLPVAAGGDPRFRPARRAALATGGGEALRRLLRARRILGGARPLARPFRTPWGAPGAAGARLAPGWRAATHGTHRGGRGVTVPALLRALIRANVWNCGSWNPRAHARVR